jgi:adenylylsulfate kinase
LGTGTTYVRESISAAEYSSAERAEDAHCWVTYGRLLSITTLDRRRPSSNPASSKSSSSQDTREDGIVENGSRYGRGFTLWFTGLSGAGKTTISEIVEKELRERFGRVEVLDGDIVRTNLSKGLTFSREDRDTNILRIGFVAELLTRNGVGVIVSAISPFKEARDQVRRNIGEDFLEVYVDAPLEVCAERDVKGLYKKAFAGEIEQFTGVSDPYEPPAAPELHIKTDEESPEESARRVIARVEELGYLRPVREFDRA